MSDNSLQNQSEFTTLEEAKAYDRWFRAKVLASLADQRPTAAHGDVMNALRQIIKAERKASTSGPMTE